MLTIRMRAIHIIAKNKSSNGKYKGQVVTRCVVEKVMRQVRTTIKVAV